MVRGLLSEDRLDGPHPVVRDVGPELYAFLVDADDLDDARETIRENCEAWGGGMWPLLPFIRGRDEPDTAWAPLLDDATVDAVVSRGFIDGSHCAARLRDTRVKDYHSIEPIWSIVDADRRLRGHRPQLAPRLPLPEHPWFVSYLACLGEIGEPDPHLLERAGLRDDLALGDLVELYAGPVPAPGPRDLVRTLRDAVGFPRRMSMRALGVASAGWSQDLVTEPRWTVKHWVRSFTGSNIAVVYEPGSVADLCLIWNLRAAHGLPDGLPLGIPASDDVIAGLRTWSLPEPDNDGFAGKLRGAGRPFAVTSMSVARERLEEIAAAAGGPWHAIEASELLQAPHRPTRRSRDVAAFSEGEAVITALDRATAELFGHRPRWAYGLDAQVRVTVDKEPVPSLPALRNDYAADQGWRDGGFDTQAPADGGPVMVQWPSGWAMLRAAVEPHGLVIRPSVAGSASAALLRRLGDFRSLDLLRDPQLLEHLDDLARRRGISWFRNEVRRLAARASDDDAALARIEEHLQQLTMTGADNEPNLITVSALTPLLKVRRARAWVEWAERSGMLIRGLEFHCQACGAKGWRTTGEISPPVTCGGCGEEVRRPFPADNVQFRYRPSQSLLEVMGVDALPHLLCAGWLMALFGEGAVGAHPGVEFLDTHNTVVAEADVVLLLRGGQVGLAECKRRAAGLKHDDLHKLEGLADRIGAMFTCYATPQWAAECGGVWQELRRDLPNRRRFALFGEQLLRNSREVLNVLGVDATDPASGRRTAPGEIREDFLAHLQRELVDHERRLRLEDAVLARQSVHGSSNAE